MSDDVWTVRAVFAVGYFAACAFIVWGGWYMSQPSPNANVRGIRIGTGIHAIAFGVIDIAYLMWHAYLI